MQPESVAAVAGETRQASLLAREEIAGGTTAFRLAKPPGFAFKAGQAIDLILPDRPGAEAQDTRHAFSLVNAPFETELVVATRMRGSAYKRALGSLPIGAPLRLDGPFGSLTLHKDRTRGALFIAGGIGITPFMSILRQSAKDRIARLALLYSNRRPEDAAFLPELKQLAGLNPGFRLVATMTEMEKSSCPWNGETGFVDDRLIVVAAKGLPSPIYYLAGPPAMVAAVRKTLARMGVDDDDIRSEEFYGY